jgi:hypothetical protein
MKLLMTVQPKNGEKPSDPMLIDTDESSLCCQNLLSNKIINLLTLHLSTHNKILIISSLNI